MPVEPLPSKTKDRHASQPSYKRTSTLQAFRQDPIRDRLVTTRLHDHGYFRRGREGGRRIRRYPLRFHHHLARGPPPPMPPRVAYRLRIRSTVRRLASSSSWLTGI